MMELFEMARIGFLPVGTSKTIEVYVNTNDGGKIPHFHVRKYKHDWEACVYFEYPEFFFHGKKYQPDDKIPADLGKELNKFFDTQWNHGLTYWQRAIDEWNENNSDVKMTEDDERFRKIINKHPNYSKLKF